MARSPKTPKFELFNSLSNCFGPRQKAVQTVQQTIDEFGAKKVVFEFGCGAARLAIELARRHSDWLVVAIDLKSDRMARPAKAALEEGVENVIFLQLDGRKIGEVIKDSTADDIWVTFPDPFPRKRQAKHRQTHPDFLKQYRKLLKEKGSLFFKTDDQPLFEYSIESFVADSWTIKDLVFDLHGSKKRRPDAEIVTVYEERWLSEGLATKFLLATPS